MKIFKYFVSIMSFCLFFGITCSAEEVDDNVYNSFYSAMDSCDFALCNSISDTEVDSPSSEVAAINPINMDEYYGIKLSEINETCDGIFNFVERIYDNNLNVNKLLSPTDDVSCDSDFYKYGYYEGAYLKLSEIESRLEQIEYCFGDLKFLFRNFDNLLWSISELLSLISNIGCIISFLTGFLCSKQFFGNFLLVDK